MWRCRLSLLLLFLTACSRAPSPSSAPAPPGVAGATEPGAGHAPAVIDPAARSPGALCRRANEYWKARVDEDAPTLLAYHRPEDRGQIDPQKFAAWLREQEPFKFYSYAVGRCEVDGELGWVELAYRTSFRRVPDSPPRDIQKWEKWQLIAGEWYPIMAREARSYPEPPHRRNRSEEAKLRTRFEQAWEARRDGKLERLLEFIDPADKDLLVPEQVQEQEQLRKWLACEVLWVEVIEDAGRVAATYTTKRSDPSLSKWPEETQQAIEHWVRRDGVWYRDVHAVEASPGPESQPEGGTP
jgi:hypothetical protein